MLGDAERPADHRAIGTCVHVRDRLDLFGGDTALVRRVFERERLDRLPVCFEPGRRVLDEAIVCEARVDDLARDCVRERDIGSDIDRKPFISPLGGCRAARIDADELRAVMNALEDVMEKNRMRFARVRAPQENDVRMLRFEIRIRAATSTEDCRQTDDRGSMSSSVAAVDVVRAKDRSSELLREIVRLVRRPRTAENAERVTTIVGHRAAEAVRSGVERLVPRGGLENAVLSY